ncbi:hypothetical protein [Nesterenkonia alkaliphila]|uniref:Uncharacterized protein n=1 Tax=Nesterenkonia alkaliphila TaxID=1463631 RepID=A0A7K1UGF7_9MICC|nr:hypothetical protein [Nesterenkonia alkaliphila]MVT25484.1 hypothetical protein [Nesterenkonia alkaliphila]GFZ96534.1 hypothetical protein GCM10011359_27490 [Nesterenkonia alkaliphila]
MSAVPQYSQPEPLALSMGQALVGWAERQAELRAMRRAAATVGRAHREKLSRYAFEQREAAILKRIQQPQPW